MYKDILTTVFKVSWPILLICVIAFAVITYATRPRKEDGHKTIKYRSVKVYKKRKPAKKAG